MESFPTPPQLLEELRRGTLASNIKLLREVGVGLREGRHYLWDALKAGPLSTPDNAPLPGPPASGASARGFEQAHTVHASPSLPSQVLPSEAFDPNVSPGQVSSSGGGLWWVVLLGLAAAAYYFWRD